MKLIDYRTGNVLREATAEELAESVQSASRDGGAGVIQVPDYEDTPVYVEGENTPKICPDCGKPLQCLSCSTGRAGRVGGLAKGPRKARSRKQYQAIVKVRWDKYRAEKAKQAAIEAAEMAYKEASQPA